MLAAVLLTSGLSIACGSSSSSTPSSPTPTPSAATGTLQVGISAGNTIPGTGFTATVDGSMSQTGQTDNRVTFTGLSAGEHTVAMSVYSTRCATAGDNPRHVTVVSGRTVMADFEVMCSAAAPATPPTR